MKWKAAILIGLLVVAATLVVLQRGSASSYEFVNVGGESNECECTKRIERTDNWWSSLLK
jgi:hypothetical protein